MIYVDKSLIDSIASENVRLFYFHLIVFCVWDFVSLQIGRPAWWSAGVCFYFKDKLQCDYSNWGTWIKVIQLQQIFVQTDQ